MLLGVERGEHYGLVVHFGGVLIDSSCGLGAEVAIARVEVKRTDVVSTMGAGEPHTSLDAGDGVETLHRIECSLLAANEKARGVSGEGNDGEVLMYEAGGFRSRLKFPARPLALPLCKGSFDCGYPSRLRREGNPRSG